ncbi:anion transporter [Streptoalloteichus tenebrarius]|uniref:Anion transporter n=1 Tax=Streptoalloteichus tenebrarius (strain ATCC 17920 / DSM 40477 / JCM 4838 / CBS 697.72 / NBRC 16177 / NCIMB 11028 / NRRL B-12390 / A12253. 1 / ISP 5477) TaxID=1933 RepID=A0ABT1HUS0_STRSD|nr:SLC13 family permease [Streptoalloteichus tenebrarius]MCP2259271.1 anion transporter [Streptoalloteichus tenebrarius]
MRGRQRFRRLGRAAAVVGVGAVTAWIAALAPGLNPVGERTLVVFAVAVSAWTLTQLDDTFVALAAAVAAVLVGALPPDRLFAALGEQTIWLLVAAFVLAAGITATGLPARGAVLLVGRARSVRGLAHLVTLAVVVSALVIPATAGRAALALPVFLALAHVLRDRPALVRALAILFPTVILLSAVASLIGAGAHLITVQMLATATGAPVSFAAWLLWGLPFALVSSHLATEVVLLLFLSREERGRPLRVDPAALAERTGVPRGPLRRDEQKVCWLLAAVVVLWCAEPLHGLPPALVALAGALVITAPRTGTTDLGAALAQVPWSLLVFMAATTALADALTSSGAAAWLAGEALAPLAGSPLAVLAGVVLVSTAAHVVIQSRSARSSVLVPLVIPLAVGAGLNPTALAFASTAAAGFCHSMPAAAKPVAMFARVEGAPTYGRPDLLRLSAVLGPLVALLVVLFAVTVWPLLGLPWH